MMGRHGCLLPSRHTHKVSTKRRFALGDCGYWGDGGGEFTWRLGIWRRGGDCLSPRHKQKGRVVRRFARGDGGLDCTTAEQASQDMTANLTALRPFLVESRCLVKRLNFRIYQPNFRPVDGCLWARIFCSMFQFSGKN